MSNREKLLHTSGLNHNPNILPNPPISPLSFFASFLHLLKHPLQVIRLWNWKNAVLSIVLRGPIFTVAGWRQGWKTGLAALFTESVFCGLSAGFYGAMVQSLKDAEPEWLTGIFLAGVVPIFFQVAEYFLHRFRGTPHLLEAAIVSLVVSSISALFNWYAMRRGTLLVGGASGSFGRDLLSLPRLLLGFVTALPAQILARMKGNSSRLLSGVWGMFLS